VTTGSTTAVVAVCQGHRCRALLAGQQLDGMDALREAARRSDHGVLLSTACAGSCSHAPVVVLGTGQHHSATLQVTPSAVLVPVGPAQLPALAEYLQDSAAPLPPTLTEVRFVMRAAG